MFKKSVFLIGLSLFSSLSYSVEPYRHSVENFYFEHVQQLSIDQKICFNFVIRKMHRSLNLHKKAQVKYRFDKEDTLNKVYYKVLTEKIKKYFSDIEENVDSMSACALDEYSSEILDDYFSLKEKRYIDRL